MSDLNPIINPQINLERPISDPVPATGFVDVGGALAGLVGLLPRKGSGGSGQPDANTRKNLALQSFSQTVNDWYNSDMTPQDFTTNVRGAALEVIGRNPEYRSDVTGIMEAVGVGAPTIPTTTEDAYNKQWNEYINSSDGVADMIAAARYAPGGTLDEAETYGALQVSFQQRMAQKAEREQLASDLSAVENDNKLHNELETRAVRTISPNWGRKSSDVLSGMFGAVAQGDATLDSPEEQIMAIVDMRRNLALQFRTQAAEAGITDPTKYEDELTSALAPFDTILEGLKSKEIAATSYLNAYNAMAEVQRTEAFVDVVGYIKGTSPAYQEAAMAAMATAAYSDGLDNLITSFEQQNQLGRPEGLTVFPYLPASAEEGVGTPVSDTASAEEIAKLRDLESREPGALANQVQLGTELLLASKDSKTTLDSFATIVAATSAQDSPVGINRLKSIFNPTAIRTLSNAAKDGSTGQDIESLVATFAGEQLRRNKITADNLAEGLNGVTTEYRNGKLVIIQNGNVVPAIVNPKGLSGRMGELITAVQNINYINSSVARIGAVGEATQNYSQQMFQPQLGSGDIEGFLNQPQNFTGQLSNVQPMSSGSNDYVSQAQVAARNAGVDTSLFLALVDQESKFDPNAVSQVGAFGLTQAMPNTAADPGYGVRPLTDTGNPTEQLRFGAEYLQAMLGEFNGDVVKSLVAYNWGVGNAKNWDGNFESLPTETQDYVKKIVANSGLGYRAYQYNGAPTYQSTGNTPRNISLNTSMNPLVNSLEGASSMTQPYAVDHMDFVLNGPFQEMQQLFGAPLTINDAIAKAGTSREKDTTGSQHFHGNAIDISLAGMGDEDKLRVFQSALQAGFTGFGFGNNILHVDIGPTRSWAYGNSTFGGMSISELQGMIANGAAPRLLVPTPWKKGSDKAVGVWEQETDPEEGIPTDFVAIKEQAPTESPRPAQQPEPETKQQVEQEPAFQSTRTTSSQQATAQLNEQTIAMLRKEGVGLDTIPTFNSVEEAKGKVDPGSLVNINGKLVMVE